MDSDHFKTLAEHHLTLSDLYMSMSAEHADMEERASSSKHDEKHDDFYEQDADYHRGMSKMFLKMANDHQTSADHCLEMCD